MTSLQRRIFPSYAGVTASTGAWVAGSGLLLVAFAIVMRSCGYDFATVAKYAAYLALHVALPGVVALHLVFRVPLSPARMLALAVPTGFAIEIFTFLSLSALDAKPLFPWTPVVWIAAGVTIRLVNRRWPVRLPVSAHHAGVMAWLALAFLGTAVMAASQMFAESPLAQGLPTRAIFHDWVYLVSRAAVIKNHWPLDDPSLSGTPLQYHYFMMVHAAAVSWTTDIEITAVMLRLVFVPLGAVLVAQAYLLGRMVSRSPWGGVIAALLTVVVSEVSFQPSYGDPLFLGLFVRWLFVSPTFFFGMIFCGAILLAVAQCARLKNCHARHYVWLFLLGTTGTGAKGTVLPVLIGALGLWAAWRWLRERRVPWRVVAFAGCLVTAFAVVYFPTMSEWRTGNAALRPFHVFELTGFWKQYLPAWREWLAQWLPTGAALTVASVACGAVVFAGTCGVRLLAIPYLFWGSVERRDAPLVGWLGAFFVASAGMGLLMELNSHGELYVILMMRLPMAVLTAGFLVATSRRIAGWWREQQAAPSLGSASPFARIDGRPVAPRGGQPPGGRWLPRLILGTGAMVLAATLGMQTSLWWVRNRAGLAEWIKTPTDLKPDGYMQELQEALLWVRNHTEPNAVLVANACTPENMRKDHWGALDRTLTGVHFYYSALSERRLWFEGPNYIMDTTRARIRANLASNFFYRGRPLDPELVNGGPCYVLLDRTLPDGADVILPVGRRVFSNRRIDVFQMSEPVVAEAAFAAADGDGSH